MVEIKIYLFFRYYSFKKIHPIFFKISLKAG